jgi:hypothetical protein
VVLIPWQGEKRASRVEQEGVQGSHISTAFNDGTGIVARPDLTQIDCIPVPVSESVWAQEASVYRITKCIPDTCTGMNPYW